MKNPFVNFNSKLSILADSKSLKLHPEVPSARWKFWMPSKKRTKEEANLVEMRSFHWKAKNERKGLLIPKKKTNTWWNVSSKHPNHRPMTSRASAKNWKDRDKRLWSGSTIADKKSSQKRIPALRVLKNIPKRTIIESLDDYTVCSTQVQRKAHTKQTFCWRSEHKFVKK